MGFFETVLTKTVENFYGSSVTAISSLKIAELLGYTTIAASILALAFVSVSQVARMDERKQAKYRIALNIVKYLPYTSIPMFLVSLLLLYASSVNILLKETIANICFIFLTLILVFINMVCFRFFVLVIFRRLYEAVKIPSDGL